MNFSPTGFILIINILGIFGNCPDTFSIEDKNHYLNVQDVNEFNLTLSIDPKFINQTGFKYYKASFYNKDQYWISRKNESDFIIFKYNINEYCNFNQLNYILKNTQIKDICNHTTDSSKYSLFDDNGYCSLKVYIRFENQTSLFIIRFDKKTNKTNLNLSIKIEHDYLFRINSYEIEKEKIIEKEQITELKFIPITDSYSSSVTESFNNTNRSPQKKKLEMYKIVIPVIIIIVLILFIISGIWIRNIKKNYGSYHVTKC